MPKKRTQKKPAQAVAKTKKVLKGFARKTADTSSSVLGSIWKAIQKIVIAIYEFIKTILKAVLMLIEKILRFIVDIIFAVAKVIQAVGVAFLAVSASAFLVILAGYLFAKAVDLPASAKFQEFRETTFGILLEAAEPDFAAWREASQAWIEYRQALKELYESDISREQKLQQLEELKKAFYQQIDTYDPKSVEMMIREAM